MSSSGDEGGAAAPAKRRQSRRARKTVERLGAGPSKPNQKKGKRVEGQDDDEEDELSSSEEEQSESESEEEFEAPKPKRASGRASTGGAKSVSARKPSASAKKGKGKAKKADDDDEDAEEGAAPRGAAARDFKINDDNGIFNAVKSPNAALQSTVDDWVQSYQDEAGIAMAELVNFLLRCCGCNATVDEHQAEDENGIVESLSDIQDEFKNESNLAYPLVSKSKGFKTFHRSLGSFLSRLYAAAATSEILYDTNFCDLFQAWIQSLSSSKIRAFRHTATIISLSTVSALNSVHAAVAKEHGQANRAKEAEQKKGRKDKARLKDLEKRAKAVHERQTKVEEYLDLLYEGVFVNRYRDSDAAIRAECIKALGDWMKHNPDYWLEGDYLRYIGWVLSDDSKDARRESVRALFALYAKDTHIGTLQHFTERFKGQLVHMATGELDLTVRVQSIQVLRQIEHHGLLDEDQRDEIAKLVFETERRVRIAAADFFQALLGEEVAKRETELEAGQATPKGKKKGSAVAALEAKDQLKLKCLAELLVKYGRALDGLSDEGSDDEDDDEATARKEAEVIEVKTHRGRIAFAVEALWDQVEAIRDWQAIMDFLLLDHSAESTNEDTPKAKGRKDAEEASSEGAQVQEACRLSEEEETLLVEVLVASLTRTTTHGAAISKKEKEKEDDVQAEVSRAVIEALPRLFAKHQTIPARIVDILSIPRLISLDLYLDMRMLTAYEGLWDDVTKQFLKHTDPNVLDQAVQTITKLNASTTLGNSNQTKMAELEDTLASSLRQAVVGKDVESSAFEEDELLALQSWLARIDKLLKVTNLCDSLDETEEGQQTSAWEIVDSLVERGRLGYKDEASMIEHALSILGTHFIWQLNTFIIGAAASDQPDLLALAGLCESRSTLVAKLEEFSVGQNSNAAEGVKQTALSLLLDMHVLSNSAASVKRDPDGQLADLRLPCSEELQARCAGFIEAEIERHLDELTLLRAAEESEDAVQSEEEEEEDSDDDAATQKQKTAAAAKAKKAKAAKKGGKEDVPKKKSASQIRADKAKEHSRLIASRRFERVIYPFVRAIHAGSIDLRHSAVLLTHYERFSTVFDKWCKLLGEDLRDEGLYAVNGGELVAQVVATSLQSACTLYLDSEESDEHLVSLGRMLVNSIVVRGAQLAITKRLPAEDHVKLHTESLSFIVKKIAAFEDDKRTQARNRALSFFKALAQLLLGVDGKSALTIKNSLDLILEENKVEVSATSKTWEPVRAYKKRLVTAMSKDPSIRSAAQQKAKKGKGKRASSADDDDEDHEAASGEDQPAPAARARSRPPRKSATKARKSAAADAAADDGEEEDEVLPPRKAARGTPKKRGPVSDDEAIEDAEEVVRSPAKKRKVERQPRQATEESEVASRDAEEEQEDVEVEDLLLSSPHKKRQVSEVVEDEEEDPEPEEQVEDEIEGEQGEGRAAREVSPAVSQVSLSDIRRQKKKARR